MPRHSEQPTPLCIFASYCRTSRLMADDAASTPIRPTRSAWEVSHDSALRIIVFNARCAHQYALPIGKIGNAIEVKYPFVDFGINASRLIEKALDMRQLPCFQ